MPLVAQQSVGLHYVLLDRAYMRLHGRAGGFSQGPQGKQWFENAEPLDFTFSYSSGHVKGRT